MARKLKFIVQDVFAIGTVNIVVGESGAGKTTWAIQTFGVHYLAGEPVLGKDTKVFPIYYASFDRGPDAFSDLLWRLSIPEDAFPWKCWDATVRLDQFQSAVKATGAKVVIIDGIEHLVPTGSPTGLPNSQEVSAFLRSLGGWAHREQLVIIGIAQAAKERSHNRVEGARHQTIGSVYWGAGTETMVTIRRVANSPRERLVSIDVHVGAPFELKYVFTDEGEFVINQVDDEVVQELDFIDSLDPEQSYSARDLQIRAATTAEGWSRATFYRRLRQFIANGQLQQNEDGTYRRAF